MNPEIKTILAKSKASNIPKNKSGLWFIYKKHYNKPQTVDYRGQERTLPSGGITYLMRTTKATVHLNPPGEVVMEDTIFELETHLGFILNASGNVLITGLGLGCVIRGLLTNPNVKHITCIEKSSDVLKLVQPYMPEDRLKIIHADALEWTKENKFKFDYAWHDLWTDMCAGEPHLDVWHTKLIRNCVKKVKNQGAWRYNRSLKRLMSERNIELIA
jgi:hypothetical protein